MLTLTPEPTPTEGIGRVESVSAEGAALPQLDSLIVLTFRRLQQEASRRLNGEVDHAKDENRLIMEDHCVVCFEHYNISDTVMVLPWGHLFYHECAWDWFSIQSECPMCRRSLNEA